MWWVCFQCSERRTFTFLNGFTSLKTNKKILGNRHCPYLKCLWNAKSGVSTQFRRRGMRPAGGQRATDTFTLLSSIFCLIDFFSTVLIRFSWINSIHSDDKGCVRLAVTTWLALLNCSNWMLFSIFNFILYSCIVFSLTIKISFFIKYIDSDGRGYVCLAVILQLTLSHYSPPCCASLICFDLIQLVPFNHCR